MLINFKKLSETAIKPRKANIYAAGFDLFADTDTETTIQPHETVMLPTNIALEIPNGYFGAIYPRSGLSTKSGLRIANCVGVIDCDFRGGIGLPIHNDTDVPQVVYPHERVAQLVIQRYPEVEFVEKNHLSETERGTSGFGSTGKQ